MIGEPIRPNQILTLRFVLYGKRERQQKPGRSILRRTASDQLKTDLGRRSDEKRAVIWPATRKKEKVGSVEKDTR